mmetsp:Transcript_17677/g.24931  ORF Transcript_17677/g.24931 Transcript_17677/m.24931 type:complete len:472 (+) Transcript_17677:121-1536(+)
MNQNLKNSTLLCHDVRTRPSQVDSNVLLPGIFEDVWVKLLEFLNTPLSHGKNVEAAEIDERSLRCTCKEINKTLASEEYYQAKVSSKFELIRGKHPSANDVGGWRVLYDRILSIYAPLEGLHCACNAWPWGLLIDCKFEAEKFYGEVIRSIPDSDNNSQYKKITEKLFEITFKENGTTICEILGEHAFSSGITSSSNVENSMGLLFPRKTGATLFQITWNQSTNNLINPLPYRHEILENKYLWPTDPSDLAYWVRIGRDHNPSISDLLRGLQNKPFTTMSFSGQYQLVLEHINNPRESHNTKSPKESFHIKPGLYIGNYGDHYRHFKHEVIQVSYVDTTNLSSIEEIFGKRLGKERQKYFKDSTLIVAHKFTGDIHVPAGEISWFVDLSNNISHALPEQPFSVQDEEGNQHTVKRSWTGFGTLAGLRFNRPKWDKGRLLLLENNLFAFIWEFHQPVVVLHEFPYDSASNTT